MKPPMPADVQLALRQQLAKALVSDYLEAQKALRSGDGEHPPRDDNPSKAGTNE
jgi:hypothetical protein